MRLPHPPSPALTPNPPQVIFAVIPWTEVSKAGPKLREVSGESILSLIGLGLAIHCGYLLFNYPLSFLVPMDTYDRKVCMCVCPSCAPP